jgi:SAM-dependent methyltransferase
VDSWGLSVHRRTIAALSDYVLDHGLEGEAARLALMSRLLDPLHRRQVESLHIGPGARTLEVGCGNGSISAWLAGLVSPSGRAVAVDIDLSLAAGHPGLELRRHDILSEPVEPRDFDLVTARAVLHHLPDPGTAIANMLGSLRPGGWILLIEPDFLPVSVAEPEEVRVFWDGWLAWARRRGIDYHVGRSLAPGLAALGLEDVAGDAETAVYNGGSPWADYWRRTIIELREELIGSGELDGRAIEAFLARCADPSWWTQTIAFTAVRARRTP